MMGRTHMSFALAVYTTCWLPRSIHEVVPWTVGAGATVLSSILPDIDEPGSTIGSIVMPIIPSWLRPVAFLLIGGYLVYFGLPKHLYIAIFGAILVFCALIKHRNSPTHGVIGLGITTALVLVYQPTLLFSNSIGYGSHLLLDILTEGVALLWPFPIWIKIQITKTGSMLEKVLFNFGAKVWMAIMVILTYAPFLTASFRELTKI